MGLKTKATVEDYRRLPEGSPYQLIEGELVMSPAPKPVHQIVSGNLFEVLRKGRRSLKKTAFTVLQTLL